MNYLLRFNENWVTSTTTGEPIEYDYTSKDKIYYGVHDIFVIRDSKRIKVKAKFDTGARTSSIDFSVAKKLGFSGELLDECKKLDSIEISKDIKKSEQKEIEKSYTLKLSKKFPEITKVEMSKSSSGFSIRAYVKIKIEYFGRVLETEVNLRDRAGLSCEMLVGLKDMI
jgi:hypothetical protein